MRDKYQTIRNILVIGSIGLLYAFGIGATYFPQYMHLEKAYAKPTHSNMNPSDRTLSLDDTNKLERLAK